MKIFISTNKTQGQRESDFCFTNEGEYVYFPFVCDRDAKSKDYDGGCGCGRAVAGFDSFKSTTTFTVADLPISKAEYVKAYIESQKKAGWADFITIQEMVKDCEELIRLADFFTVGAILEKRGNRILRRMEARSLVAKSRREA